VSSIPRAFLVANRRRIDRLLVLTAVVCTSAALVAALCLRMPWIDIGPRSGAAATFLAAYAAPMFLAAPLWWRGRLAAPPRVQAIDAAVTLLAFARFVIGEVLPFSGHMLFLVYSLLAMPVSRGYRLLALALVAETTVFKLWIWRDPRSWAIGMVLGVAAAALASLVTRRR
jgi:hypothetical protein